MTAPPLDKCPRCNGKPERLISGGAGLLFKGDGFYITDYRSEGYKKDAKKEAPKSDSKPDTKSEKKPESKPDKKSSDS